MIKPTMYYSQIDGGHSVGQELEYLLIKGDKPYDFIDMFVQELKLTLPGINRRKNSPKVYVDAWNLELCSSPHTNISDLYEEMSELYEAMASKAKNKGIKIIKNSSYNFKKLDKGNRFTGSHVHVGNPWLTRTKLLEALTPYLPIFVALANNSSTKKYPKGSERLRNGPFGKMLSKNNHKQAKAIFKHEVAPTIEIRCLDRSKTLEEDIAIAAFVYATAEKLKENFRFFSQNIMHENFVKLYFIPKFADKDSLSGLSEILLQNAAKHGFDTKVNLIFTNYDVKKTLKDIAKQHYLEIQDKLHEIHTPKNLIKILEEKIQ